MSKIGEESKAREMAEKSKIPLLPTERSLGFIDHTFVATAGSVATWLFLTGCWIGMAMPVVAGIINVTFVTLIGVIPIAFMGIYFCRWGVEHSIGFIPTFGTVGVRILMIVAFLPIYWAWASIPPIMFGRSLSKTAEVVGVTSSFWTSPTLWGLVVLVAGWWIAFKGSDSIKWLGRVAVPAMIVLIVLLTWRMFSFYGLDMILAQQPVGLHADHFLSFMIGVEISIAVGLSWIGNSSEYTRMCKSEPNAFWGIIIGWAIMWGVLCIPGLLAGAMVGSSDPIEVLAGIGGGWTVIYLILLAVANPTSVVMEIYMLSLMLMGIFPGLKWKWATLISIPVISFFILMPWAYDVYGGFVTMTAAILAPIAGVWLVSAIMTKFMLNLKEALDTSKKSAYYFYGGVNIWAFVAIVVGCGFSLLIYNPLTCEIHIESIFRLAGASIPAFLISGIGYFILARIFYVPKKIGFPEIPEARK